MFRHVGIVVNDIEKMISFYRNIIGLEIYSDEIESGPFINDILKSENLSARIIKLGKNSQTILELLDFNNKKKSCKILINQIGITHFAFTVDNLNFLYASLIKNNIEVLSEPKISVNKQFLVCFCKDPENNYLELVEKL